MTEIRERTIRGLKSGDQFVVSRTLTEKDTRLFADLTRDYNPVHFDDRFAAAKNLTGRICHGLLVAGLVTEVGGQIGWLATGLDIRFRRPVYFGDTVTCTFTVTEVGENDQAAARVDCTNQKGAVVMEAEIRGFLPGPVERRIMAETVRSPDSRR